MASVVCAALGCAMTPRWTAAGQPPVVRSSPIVVGLDDGRVLVIGGFVTDQVGNVARQVPVTACDLYDPEDGTWTTASPLPIGLEAPLAAATADVRVLVIDPRADAALTYDPFADTWTPVATPGLLADSATLTTRPGAPPLLAGGFASGSPTDVARLYDVQTDSWMDVAPLPEPRYEHAASALLDGRVLVSGGTEPGDLVDTADLYDPASDTWIAVAPMLHKRHRHLLLSLPDGRVAALGGGFNTYEVDPSGEVYDPASDAWIEMSEFPHRIGFDAVALSDGTILLAGGRDSRRYRTWGLKGTLLYNPALDGWIDGARLLKTGSGKLVELPNDSVLFVRTERHESELWLR
ncbi:MAG TPA: kelch repeat-containing protein [Myxococcota bacterium]|nr:kelch repeat-containing protein [Myxococcota bacterium]